MSLSQIQFTPILPLEVIFGIGAAGVAACWLQFRLLQRRLSRQRALGISLLRFGSVFLILLIAANPFWTEKKEVKIRPSLAVLLDTSPSMGLAGESGKSTRLEDAKNLLFGGSTPLLRTLTDRYEVRFFELNESLRPLQAGEIAQIKSGSQKGDFNEAVETLGGKNQLILLFTDGNMKGEAQKSSRLPLLAFPLGNQEDYRDILIRRVKAPPIAFRGKEVVIDAVIQAYGYRGLTVPVILKSGEKLLATKSVRLQGSSGEGDVSLSFTPEEIGQYTLSLSIPPQVGESLTANNKRDFSLKVVRDKIRVLMVSGSPSMNYRFLRTALKNDPAIDLLSFVILRMPSNILNVPVQEQSLIPFPVDTLFTKELKNFDLLIFDNFLYHPFFRTQYLGNIRDFVKEGGAFAFVGGSNFQGEGGYAGTPLEEILPTRWLGKESYRRTTPVPVRPSRAGMNHPITRFSADEPAQRNLWREMPPLDGFNPLESKNNGTVLLEGAEGGFWPILTVGSYGKGRVFVLATDDSWKWYMGMVAKDKEPYTYLRLIERLIRWVTKDPGLETVQIALPEKGVAVSKEVEFRVRTGSDEPKGKQREAVSLAVFNPQGVKIAAQLKATGQPDQQQGAFVPGIAGAYKIRVESRQGVTEEVLLIPDPLQEFDGSPNHDRLRQIASSVGGKVIMKGDDALREIEDMAGKMEKRFVEEKTKPFWENPYFLALIVALLTSEWYLRRRWGLI